MTSQLGEQTITIRILRNIVTDKVNQAMKFGSSVKYNVKNLFLQESCKK